MYMMVAIMVRRTGVSGSGRKEAGDIPKDPLPIFLPIRYFPPTRKSIAGWTSGLSEEILGKLFVEWG